MLENHISVTYLEAWSRWLNGESVSNYILWNAQILWWGRMGKLVSAISALTIITEIIGPTRLREFGASLHNRIDLQVAFNRLKKSLAYLRLMRRVLTSAVNEREPAVEDLDEPSCGFLLLMSFLIAGAWLGAGLTFYEVYFARGFWLALGGCLIAFVLGVYSSPVVASLILSVPPTVLLVIDVVGIKPLAWLLERKALDRLVKLGSLALLIIGLHFDLLAS